MGGIRIRYGFRCEVRKFDIRPWYQDHVVPVPPAVLHAHVDAVVPRYLEAWRRDGEEREEPPHWR